MSYKFVVRKVTFTCNCLLSIIIRYFNPHHFVILRGVVANVFDCDIKVHEFEFHLH